MTEDELDSLLAICRHYGMPQLIGILDTIVDNVRNGVTSVPLDCDPEKAALKLYAERMKLDGVIAMRNAFVQRVKAVKESAT